MKRCPACNRLETDDTLGFCRADGTALVNDSLPASSDSRPAFGSANASSEIETSILPHSTGAGISSATSAATVFPAQTALAHTQKLASSKSRRAIVLAIGGVIVVALAVSAYFYLSRKQNTTIDSIAVLPFVNQNRDPDTEYLSDGLAESLIYRLSQLSNLKVSPTSSVFRYKGKEIDPIKVGNELGVSAVLSGRITQRGENLTISAELLDVRDKKLLWGEHYDRKMTELLATQREIAHEIVDNLRLKVSPEERGLAKHYTESNEAYQLYLKGRFYWNKRTGEALKRAIDYFNQAIEQDRGFALAYAGMADCYVVPANTLPPHESMPKAKAAAIRALHLDDSLAEAHTSLARVLAVYDWNWIEAEHEFKRAIELNPNYAVAHQWYGGYLESMNRLEEATAEEKRALELDPLAPIQSFSLGLGFYYAHNYDKAIEYYQKTLELDPNFPPAYSQLPAAYEQKRMYDQAIAGFQKGIALKSGGEWYFSLGGLGHVYAVSGRTNEARATLNQLKRISEQKSNNDSEYEYERMDRIALIYAGLGDKDQAFAWLEKAYEERAFNLAWLNVDPRWDNLRPDPRFTDLLKRIGLPR
jgi:TolB-like protein/Flp pilus assembly protein TadD